MEYKFDKEKLKCLRQQYTELEELVRQYNNYVHAYNDEIFQMWQEMDTSIYNINSKVDEFKESWDAVLADMRKQAEGAGRKAVDEVYMSWLENYVEQFGTPETPEFETICLEAFTPTMRAETDEEKEMEVKLRSMKHERKFKL